VIAVCVLFGLQPFGFGCGGWATRRLDWDLDPCAVSRPDPSGRQEVSRPAVPSAVTRTEDSRAWQSVRVWAIAQTACVLPDAADMARLAAIAGDASRPLRHTQRACIIMRSADRLSVQADARRASAARPCDVGSSATARQASRDCCTIRRASSARRPTRPRRLPRGWHRPARNARRGHALDQPCRGSNHRDLVAHRAADSGGPLSRAASAAHVKALARRRVRQGRERAPIEAVR
jgi:hypothetical protein